MSSDSSNGGSAPAAPFRVNTGVDARNNGFPHNEYYNTRVWQSPQDFYLFRERYIYPFFHPEFRLVISKVQPRPQYSYIHSVVSAVIEQLNPKIREPYGMDHGDKIRSLLPTRMDGRYSPPAEKISFMAARMLTPFAHWAFRNTVLYHWLHSFISGSGSGSFGVQIRSLTPAGLIVFCICKLVVEGQNPGIWPRHQLPLCSRKVKL